MRANDSTRRDPVALFFIASVLLACCAAAAMLERANPPVPRSYVVWRSPSEARTLANGRPILYAFVRDDASSARFEREMFGDAGIAARVNKDMVAVRLVARKNDPLVTALMARFGTGAPGLVLTNEDGENAEVLATYRGREHALAFLAKRPAPSPKQDVTTIEALSRIGHAESPSFSPDGKRIAFLSNLTGERQLWILDRDGGFPELITRIDGGVNGARWSPDGRWIALASGGQIHVVQPDGTGLRTLTSRAALRNLMSAWTKDSRLSISTLHASSPDMESSLVDPASGRAQPVAKSPRFGVVIDVACGNTVVLERDGDVRTLRVGAQQLRDAIGVLDCNTNTLLAMTNRGRDRTAFARIHKDGRMEFLWAREDAELVQFTVTEDRSKAALIWNREGRSELALLDLRSGRRELVQLPVDILGEPSFSRDGTQLVFTASSAQRPPDIWLVHANGKANGPRQLTRSAHPGVQLDRLAKPELVRLEAHDGLELSGWLYRANGSAAVIDLHGGPAQQAVPALNPTHQALVAAGITVFAPNVRGSSGFGKRFMSLDDGAQRENAIRDVLTAAHFLRSQGKKNLGIMGESYGGWLTLAVISRHPQSFQAAVDQYGMIDIETMIGEATPDVAPMLRAEYGTDAPAIDLDKITTPLLVLHGARDTQVRPSHANALLASLRRNRVRHDSIVFPDEGHGWSKTANRVKATNAIVKWFVQNFPRERA